MDAMSSFEKARDLFFNGLACIEAANYAGAEYAFREALELFPERPSVIANLAAVLVKQSKFDEASEYATQAIALDPNNAQAYLNLGLCQTHQGAFSEAIASFDCSLSIAESVEAWINRGGALAQMEKPAEALECFEKASAMKPDSPSAWLNQGNTLVEMGRHAEAIKRYDKALARDPKLAEIWMSRGHALVHLQQYTDALTSYRQALALNSTLLDAWLNTGNILRNANRLDEALAAYEKALSEDPGYIGAWLNCGNVYRDMRRFDRAIECYERVLQLDEEAIDGWLNLGNVLLDTKRYDRALECYGRAIQRDAQCADAWFRRGLIYSEQRRYRDACHDYQKALTMQPEIKFGIGHYFGSLAKICDWQVLPSVGTAVNAKVQAGKLAIQPLDYLNVSSSIESQRQCAELYVQEYRAAQQVLPAISGYDRRQKIRIGYFSADFRVHAVSILMAEVFEHHDRSRFELIAFSFYSGKPDVMTQRVMAAFDQFIDVSQHSCKEIAELARQLEIDVAVDLGGHTADNRTEAFAYRAAPVQVNYLGYPGTMGADFMDYIIGDPVVIPALTRDLYTEKVIYLPCFQANDSRREISSRVFSRAELGLPPEGVVYCCFNSNYKFTPEVFDAWMRILAQVEGSVIFLLEENNQVAANLRREAALRGVDPGRLVFGGALPAAEYLSRYRVADLFLDTLPFNAGTTASDALWSGLPVLTCAGEAFASRMAASLLHAVGLPELVTETLEAYEREAVALGRDPERLSQLKRRLVEERSRALLFDSVRFTRKLEQAYEAMYQRQQSGLAPEHIDVA